MVSRWVAISGGAFVLAIVAAALAEATVAVGHLGSLSDDARLRPGVVASPTPTPVPSPSATTTPAVTATPAPTATATPIPTVAPRKATTNSFVHLRASNSTSSAILADLNGGTAVELLSYSDSQWQQVRYNGTVGYIYKAYLTY